MQLYFSPNSIAVAVSLALFEADLPFEAVRVDFSQSEQTGPDYLKINPKARVPSLVTDQGVITETGAILDYIADLAPSANLRPSSAFDVAKMRSLIHYFASTMHVNHAHSLRGPDGPIALNRMPICRQKSQKPWGNLALTSNRKWQGRFCWAKRSAWPIFISMRCCVGCPGIRWRSMIFQN